MDGGGDEIVFNLLVDHECDEEDDGGGEATEGDHCSGDEAGGDCTEERDEAEGRAEESEWHDKCHWEAENEAED